MVRRFFHLSPDEWDELPWWESKMLLEGLAEEGVITIGSESDQQPAAAQRPGRRMVSLGSTGLKVRQVRA